MHNELSKDEKIAIFAILGIGTICIIWLLVLMLNTTPIPLKTTSTVDNSKLEIELENKNLKH